MKITSISCCAVLLVLVQLSFAQIMIGPAVGGQCSWISFDDKDQKDLYNVKPVFGFHAGANVSFLVHKRFFLHGSILYSLKGKILAGKDDPLLRNEVKYHCIDIPILYTVDFKAKIGRSKEFRYYLGLGPNLSYWLGGKGKIYNMDLNENTIPEQSYTIVFYKKPEEVEQDEMGVEDPNRIQLGLNLGAGVLFQPFGYQRIKLTFRYELGHSFFSRTTNGTFQQTMTNYQDVLRSRSQGLRISIAYLVDLRVEDRKKGKSTIRRKNI